MKMIETSGLRFLSRGKADEAVFREVVDRRCYEKPRLGFRVQSGETWLDCGANVGAFAVWAERCRGAKVFGYEACEENTVLAQRNLRLNSCCSTVQTGFVSAKRDGVTSVSFNANTPARSSSEAKGVQRFVPNVDIASEIEKHQPAGLKIDIEGGEFELLDNGFPIGNVRAVAIEYHFRFDKDCEKARGRIQPLLQMFRHSSIPKTILTHDKWPAWQDALLYFWN